MRAYDEEVMMETLLTSPEFRALILGILRERARARSRVGFARHKGISQSSDGLMTFDARDCEKMGIL